MLSPEAPADNAGSAQRTHPRIGRWLLTIYGLVALAFSIVPVTKYFTTGSLKDYRLWFNTGQIVAKGSPFFSEDDFTDLPGLVTKLAIHTDPVSQFLWNQFPPGGQLALTNSESTAADHQSALVSALNDVLRGDSLDDPARFAGVALSAGTLALRAKNPASADRTWLNRLLIEDACPSLVAKRPPHSGELYPKTGEFPFMYPPFAAAVLAPLSGGGQLFLIIVLVAVNSAAWLAAVLLSVYLITGRALRQHPGLYFWPSLGCVAFVWSTYFLGQCNLLLLALMLGAFACLRLGRSVPAGLLIALAAGIKAFPIMAVGYLVYRKYWIALVSLAVSLVVFLLVIPACFRGIPGAKEDLRRWANGMLFHYDKDTIAQRPDRAFTWKNQSLIAVANRFLRHVSSDDSGPGPNYVNIADLPFKVINGIVLFVALGLCLFYVFAMPRGVPRIPSHAAMEYSMLLLLILMFSPLSFGYFYVWLIFPLTLVLHMALTHPAGSRERTVAWSVFGLSLFFLTWAIPFPFLRVPRALGNNLLACLTLFFCLGWALRRSAGSAVTKTPAPGMA